MVYLSDAASSSSRVKPRGFVLKALHHLCTPGMAGAESGAGAGGVGHGLCQEQGEKLWMPWSVHVPSLQGHGEAHGGAQAPSSGVGVTLGGNLQLVLTVGTLRFWGCEYPLDENSQEILCGKDKAEVSVLLPSSRSPQSLRPQNRGRHVWFPNLLFPSCLFVPSCCSQGC